MHFRGIWLKQIIENKWRTFINWQCGYKIFDKDKFANAINSRLKYY